MGVLGILFVEWREVAAALTFALVPTVALSEMPRVQTSVVVVVVVVVVVAVAVVVVVVVGRWFPSLALFFSVLFEVIFASSLPFGAVSIDAAAPKTKTFVSRNESFV
jgi:hypothetical protein